MSLHPHHTACAIFYYYLALKKTWLQHFPSRTNGRNSIKKRTLNRTAPRWLAYALNERCLQATCCFLLVGVSGLHITGKGTTGQSVAWFDWAFLPRRVHNSEWGFSFLNFSSGSFWFIFHQLYNRYHRVYLVFHVTTWWSNVPLYAPWQKHSPLSVFLHTHTTVLASVGWRVFSQC